MGSSTSHGATGNNEHSVNDGNHVVRHSDESISANSFYTMV